MGKIITVVNQKDESGKTTTAVNLAASLGLIEKRTLLLDCDPQGDATDCMKVSVGPQGPSLFGALTGKNALSELVRDTELRFLDVIPAGVDLFAADRVFAGTPGKETLIRNLLSDVLEDIDYIVIDTPSSLGVLTTAAVAASDFIVIPVYCEPDIMLNLGLLLQTVAGIKKEFNPGMKIAAMVFTRCDSFDEVYRYVPPDWLEGVGKNVLLSTVAKYDGKNVSGSRSAAFVLEDVMSMPAENYLDLALELVRT